jgi:hypothetical protein
LANATSGRFIMTAAFSDGTSEDVTASSTWTSGNPNIATVGNLGYTKGQVTGVASGSVTINATYGGLTTSFTSNVSVTSPTLLSLTVSPGSGNITAGNQVRYTATAQYSDGTSQDVTENTAWTIDNLNVASLPDSASQPGQLVAVDTGSATLTATFGGLNSKVTITVP